MSRNVNRQFKVNFSQSVLSAAEVWHRVANGRLLAPVS